MCAYSQCSGTTGTTAAVGPTILSSGGDRRRAVLQLTMRDARWLQASRPAAQAAQVAENTLLRDGIVTSDPSAACASVVACCAPHGRLLEAFQLGRFQFAHGTEYVASPRARLWLRKAPGTLVWPRVRYIATTVTWRTCLGLKVTFWCGSVSSRKYLRLPNWKQRPVDMNACLHIRQHRPTSTHDPADCAGVVRRRICSRNRTERPRGFTAARRAAWSTCTSVDGRQR